MKKVVRSIATVALMFVVATSAAKEPTLSLTPNEEKSLNFEMNTTSEETLVRIIDTNGTVVYSENITAAIEYSKKFNFQNLAQGSYSLRVENDLKETVFTFFIEDSAIKIVERKENSKPVFRKAGQRVFLNFLNLEKDDVKISVYDSNNRVVFNETIKETMLVEKAFNFENAFEDTYLVVVKNGTETFYEDVLVK